MAYTASKGAILALTRDLSNRYANDNIRVNALCPGPTLTESFKKFLENNPELKDHYFQQLPMNRFAEVDEIAKAALYLASDDSSYITGSTFVVDGGITSA